MNWSDYFISSPDSPSGLVWNIDIYDSLGRLTKACKGRNAGSLSGQQRWQVKVDGKVLRCHRILYEMHHGGIPDGYVVDHEDGDSKNNKISNLILKTQRHNTMNSKQTSRNTSGVTGVDYWCGGRNGPYARSRWQDLQGKMQCKVFSVNKFGLLPSFAMACAYRENMIGQLNKQGANYTKRHGKGTK